MMISCLCLTLSVFLALVVDVRIVFFFFRNVRDRTLYYQELFPLHESELLQRTTAFSLGSQSSLAFTCICRSITILCVLLNVSQNPNEFIYQLVYIRFTHVCHCFPIANLISVAFKDIPDLSLSLVRVHLACHKPVGLQHAPVLTGDSDQVLSGAPPKITKIAVKRG